MISFALACDSGHRFDAWFRNADACTAQLADKVVSCPVCSSVEVDKALMAPAIARAAETAAPLPEKSRMGMGIPPEFVDALRALRRKVVADADYVGDRFAEEARKIHFHEVEARGIYGEATREEVAGLIEDGVDILPLPRLPDEAN